MTGLAALAALAGLTMFKMSLLRSGRWTWRGRRPPRVAIGSDHRLGLVPECRRAAVGAEVEMAGVAELEQLNPFVADRVGIGRAGRQEKAVARTEILGPELQPAGDDVIEAVGVVA